MSSNKKILFIINGYGLGNYARDITHIRRYADEGWTVHVATSGHAYSFIKGEEKISRVFPLKRLTYPTQEGKIHLSANPLHLFPIIRDFFHNCSLIRTILRKNEYEYIFTDSDYSLFFCRNTKKAKHVAVNNAHAVLTFFKNHPCPKDLRKQLWIERMDFYFNRFMADEIICPSIDTEIEGLKNLRITFPTVRKEILNIKGQNVSKEGKKKILIMLTSSGLITNLQMIDDNVFEKFEVTYLGALPPALHQFPIKEQPLCKDNSSFIKEADVLLINAGQGSISEAIVVEKPTIVFPIEHHAEQWVNAQSATKYSYIKIYDPNLSLIDQIESLS